MFFIGRFVLGQYLWYLGTQCVFVPTVFTVATAGGLLQSYGYLYYMNLVILADVKKYSEFNQRKIRMGWFTPLETRTLEKCDFYKEAQKKYVKLP